jgi:hypothetical protein
MDERTKSGRPIDVSKGAGILRPMRRLDRSSERW